jgi:hypothetical protein
MATEFIPIPDTLLAKLREAAEREDTTVEEFVRATLEQRINSSGGRLARFYAIGERHTREQGITPEEVEREIAARRLERRL